MTEDATASQTTELSADAIAAWLSEHPDFFASREMLLADLTLPHASGDAVSLVERQLRLLRDRNAELHRRLRELTDAARANHRIYERTLEITSALVDAVDPQDLVRRLAEGLRSGFDVDATSVRVVDRGGLASSLCGEATAAEVADAATGALLGGGRIVCGVLRESELAFLFGGRAEAIASAAVMPVEIRGGHVILALGSGDADHFRPDMGTLFLSFLGDTVAQRLAQLAADAGD